MSSFSNLLEMLETRFQQHLFPETPASLYEPAEYLLNLKAKRIRPVACLLACEMFGTLSENTFHAALALELFHNFTLMHDDIMDDAPLRRGKPTVYKQYGTNAAILSGDVMLVRAYEYLQKIDHPEYSEIWHLFNTTAREVCEGQQLDIDFEHLSPDHLSLAAYLRMITLKTAVLLAASLKIGGILGGAEEEDRERLYDFGKNMGIAFQIQDDYLDAFGDPVKTGKKTGNDILSNKKTFLFMKAQERANEGQKKELRVSLTETNPVKKIEQVLKLYKELEIDKWAHELKIQYSGKAHDSLTRVTAPEERKQACYLLLKNLQNRTQ